jgi:Uma2 family endonuclease
MARQGSTLKVSYEELLKLPDDGLRHELIDGGHFMTACPVLWHQLIATRVVISLGAFAAGAGCGQVLCAPVDVVLSPHDVVEPDVIFLSREHVGRIQGKFLTEPPDLVIEILSPSTRGRDLGVKLRLYERFGVPEYWALDPAAATARVFLHGPRGYEEGMLLSAARGDSLTTRFAPGWGLPLSDLFR